MGESDYQTVQMTMTIKESTIERLDELYPHHLKTQHQILAAISEVEEGRLQTRALLENTSVSFEPDQPGSGE